MNNLVALLLAARPLDDAALGGYTGIWNVPTAAVREDLGLGFRWQAGPTILLRPAGTAPVDRMYLATLPFLKDLEATMCFIQPIGWVDPDVPVLPYTVHREMALKWRLPELWPGGRVALGTVDPVSANLLDRGEKGRTHYGMTSWYGVVTQCLGPLALTLGYGIGDHVPGSWGRDVPFLDGPLAGLQWALPGGLELSGEWDGHDANGGLRWHLPRQLAPLDLEVGRVGGGWAAGATWGLRL